MYKIRLLLEKIANRSGVFKFQLKLSDGTHTYSGSAYMESVIRHDINDNSIHYLDTIVKLFIDDESDFFSDSTVSEKYQDGWMPIYRFFSNAEKSFVNNISKLPSYIHHGESIPIFNYANFNEFGEKCSDTYVNGHLRKVNSTTFFLYEELTLDGDGVITQKIVDYFEICDKENLTDVAITINNIDGSSIHMYLANTEYINLQDYPLP